MKILLHGVRWLQFSIICVICVICGGLIAASKLISADLDLKGRVAVQGK